MHLPAWWTIWTLWNFFKFLLPIVVSIAALWIVLYDRKSRLMIKARKGIWSMFREMSSVRGPEMMFQGIIEVYNRSSRPNAILSYSVWCKPSGGEWTEMEAEYNNATPPSGADAIAHNVTPLSLAPFAGAEVHVLGLGAVAKVKEYQVRIEVTDMFGRQYTVELTSYS